MADTGNIRETAQEARNRLQELTSGATQKAQEFAAAAGECAHEGLSTVGEKMSSLAGTIREQAPQEGMIGSAAGAVAQGLDTSGRYLQEHQLRDMLNDLGSIVKSYPLASLGVAFTVGCLFGSLRRR
jgi:hypothetical protein